MFSRVVAFEVKVNLLHKHINEQNHNHFPSYKTVFESSASTDDWKTLKDKFAGITQQLQNKFLSQLIYFHTRTNEIQRLQNPFAFDTIRFQCICQHKIMTLEGCFHRRKCTADYGRPLKNVYTIKTFTKKMLTGFDSTHLCEQAFLVKKFKSSTFCTQHTNNTCTLQHAFLILVTKHTQASEIPPDSITKECNYCRNSYSVN